MQVAQINGLAVLELEPMGPPLGSDRDASDILSEAFSSDATVIVLPAERLDPDFLRLRSGLAGAFIQKLQNYHCRLVILGDVSAAVAASTALRDFVYETNKVGRHIFAPDRAAMLAALS
ncbi:MAG: hypothetical protein JWR51_1986 [Devosia sp.]|uniref:DUF4180 domain-containing protein n=1 Tax=Devosia sp. TaxID=1871048 RepID=UPI00262ED1ED|nr:DUF4180 domain-containing protein [Devosia sp.]MDB5528883.1 hypothetical protein [Devosia sp.]